MKDSDKETQLNIVCGNPNNNSNIRTFTDGSIRSCTLLHTAAIGFGVYQPGWRWSLHVKPLTGKASENHIGYIISGRMMVQDLAGNKAEMEPGNAFEIPPGSDAWVIGDGPCVALDFIHIGSYS